MPVFKVDPNRNGDGKILFNPRDEAAKLALCFGRDLWVKAEVKISGDLRAGLNRAALRALLYVVRIHGRVLSRKKIYCAFGGSRRRRRGRKARKSR